MDTFKQALATHRISELSGILTALLMTVVSCIPVFTDRDPHQIAIVTFFFVLFVLRLVLFVANSKVKGTEDEQRIMAFAVRSMVTKPNKDFYEDTLYSINWISAIYTLALFTNYLLIVRESYNFMWPRYIMIAALGLTSINLALAMLKRSIRHLRVKPLHD